MGQDGSRRGGCASCLGSVIGVIASLYIMVGVVYGERRVWSEAGFASLLSPATQMVVAWYSLTWPFQLLTGGQKESVELPDGSEGQGGFFTDFREADPRVNAILRIFSRSWGEIPDTSESCSPGPDSPRLVFCTPEPAQRTVFGAPAGIQYMYVDNELGSIQLFYDSAESATVMASMERLLGEGADRGEALFWIGEGMSIGAGYRDVPPNDVYPSGKVLLIEIQEFKRYMKAGLLGG